MFVLANSQQANVCVEFILSNFPAPNELVEKNKGFLPAVSTTNSSWLSCRS